MKMLHWKINLLAIDNDIFQRAFKIIYLILIVNILYSLNIMNKKYS